MEFIKVPLGVEDLTGQDFGMLVVLGLTSQRGTESQIRKINCWGVECLCGNTQSDVQGNNLSSGVKWNCGCVVKNEALRKKAKREDNASKYNTKVKQRPLPIRCIFFSRPKASP